MTLPLLKRKWTKIQKEVWENVETYTNLIVNSDLEGFLNYFHKDYSGWNYCELMPVNKSDLKNELLHLPKLKNTSYNITPLAINIFNDVAIVHYYFSATFKTTDGKEKLKNGRNTDILLKQKDKWQLIGDHFGTLKPDKSIT